MAGVKFEQVQKRFTLYSISVYRILPFGTTVMPLLSSLQVLGEVEHQRSITSQHVFCYLNFLFLAIIIY